MAEKVTLKLTAAAAAYVRKDAPRDLKLQAARGEITVSDGDMATILYFLAHDPDTEVRGVAIRTLRTMTELQVLAIAENEGCHPKILDMLAHIHWQNVDIAAKLLAHPAIDDNTAAFLSGKLAESADDEVEDAPPEQGEQQKADSGDTEEIEEVDEESEKFQSKYRLSMKMEINEKIKVALTGDKEWRTLMIRDTNKLVATAVVKNPRITEGEVLALAQSAIQHDEIMRLLCTNKEWVKIYQIRRALVMNCKTPLQAALRFMMTLTDRDLATLAKSKNIATVISTQARRQLMNKKRQ